MIVVLEGIDASGKATQTKRLVERFKAKGLRSERFDFPRYQTKVGQEILGLLTQKWNVQGITEDEDDVAARRALVLQSLMTVNRYEFYDYLKGWEDDQEGVLVLDRYYASGVVYGSCDGLNRDFLMQLHKALPQPTSWVFVDIPVEESVTRRPIRRDEYETREGFLEKVRGAYIDLFSEHNWNIIDGLGTVDEVHDRIWQKVS